MAVLFIFVRVLICIYLSTISAFLLNYTGQINSNRQSNISSQIKSIGLRVSYPYYRSTAWEDEGGLTIAQPVSIYRIRNNAEQTECFRNNGSTSIHHSTTEGLPGRTNDTLFVYIQPTLSPILSIHSLQWARPPCSKPYRPKPNRRWGDILVSLLLLSGNVATNPGPVQHTSPETKTTFGSFNVRSAVHKAALIHDMISENKLDIMALQETWIPPDAPPTIVDDIAPPGFTAYHVHRPTRGGGLAIIIRDHFQARPVDVKWKPRLFELQLLRIHLNRK